MLKFDKEWKLYVFKKERRVSLSFLVTPTYVKQFSFNDVDFSLIMDQWRDGYSDKGACVEWKKIGTPNEYVRFSVRGNHFRLSTESMEALEEEYEHQLTNRMYWDE